MAFELGEIEEEPLPEPEPLPKPPLVVEEQDPSAIPSISDESFDELLPSDDELRVTPRPYDDETPVSAADAYFRDSVDLYGSPKAAIEAYQRIPAFGKAITAGRVLSKIKGIGDGAVYAASDVLAQAPVTFAAMTGGNSAVLGQAKDAVAKAEVIHEQLDAIRDNPDLSPEEKEAQMMPLFTQLKAIRGTVEESIDNWRETSPVVRGIEDTQRFLRERRGEPKEDTPEEDIEELGFTPATWENFVKDTKDIAAAFPGLFKALQAESLSETPEEVQGVLDLIEQDYKSGRDLSETILGGAIGGNAPILYGLAADPVETIRSAPLVTALTVVSMVTGLNAALIGGAKTAAQVVRIRGLRKLINTLEDAGLVDPDDVAAIKAAYERGDIRRVDARAEQLAAPKRMKDFFEGSEAAAAQFGTEMAEGIDAARRASQRAQAIEEFPGRVGEALAAPLQPIADLPLDPLLRKVGIERGAKKRGKVTIGDETEDLGVKQRMVGDEALTLGDLAKSSAVGAGIGLLGGAPLEAAALAPALRLLYGIGLDHPQAGRYLSGIERFIRHTSAQMGVSLEQAIRQTTDDAARAKSRLRRIIEDLDRVHRDAEAGETPFRVVGDDWSVVEGTTEVSRGILDDFQKLADEINLSDDARQLFLDDLGEISQGGAVLLRNPTIRGKVEQLLIRDISSLPVEDQSRWLASIGARIDDIVKSKERGVPVLKYGEDADIFLDEALNQVMKDLSPDELNRFKGEVIQDVMLRHETNILVKAKQKAYNIEAQRGLRDSGLYGQYKEALDAGDTASASDLYALMMLENRILRGRAPNQVLPSFVLPNDLANRIRTLHRNNKVVEHLNDVRRQKGEGVIDDPSQLALVDRIVEDSVDDLGRFRERSLKAMFGDGYEDATPSQMAEHMKAYSDELAAGGAPHLSRGQIKDIETRMAADIEAPGGAGPYISDNLANTEFWHSNYQQSRDIWNRLTNIGKMGLTVFNVPAHVNNNMSNISLQSTRLGIDPYTYMRTALAQTSRYNKWRNGKAKNVSPFEQRAYKAIDEMGIADTDLSRAELDAYAASGLTQELNLDTKAGSIFGRTAEGAIQKGSELIDKAAESSKRAYRFGDEVAKVDEAFRQFSILDKAVNRLRNGKYIDIETSPTARTRIRRGDDGELYIGKQKLTEGRRLTEKGQRRLDRTLGASARQEAMDLFVDYGQVPGFIRWLRSKDMLSIVSPFLTWNWKAMGVTGRGLLARSVFPQRRYISNDAGLMAEQAVATAGANIRRNMMLGGLRNLLHEDRDVLNQLASYDPTMPTNHLFAATADPEVMLYDNIESMNWMGPSTAWLEGVATMASYLQSEASPDVMDERSRLLALRNSGRMMTGPQTLRLVGLQGSALLPLFDLIRNDFKTKGGRKVPAPEVFRRFVLPWVIGGTPTSALDVAFAASGDLTSGFSSRLQALDEDERFEEDFLRWTVRKLTGVGFQAAAVDEKLDRYLKTVDRNLDSLIKDQEFKIQQLEDANRDGRYDDLIQRQERSLERMIDIIESEKEQIENEIEFQLDAYNLNKNAGAKR